MPNLKRGGRWVPDLTPINDGLRASHETGLQTGMKEPPSMETSQGMEYARSLFAAHGDKAARRLIRLVLWRGPNES